MLIEIQFYIRKGMMRYSRLMSVFYTDCSKNQRFFSSRKQTQSKSERSFQNSKTIHCYKALYPWRNDADLSKHLVSSIVYNKDGLIALNKPYGIKIYSHDKPGEKSKKGQRYIVPSIPDCDLTIQDSLGNLKEHLNVPNLTILKSAERYTSGIVLLSTNDKTSAAVKKSFNIAKLHRKNHLIHWMITLGYPVMNTRKEKVGIKFLEAEKENEIRQPVIVMDISKRDCKLKRVHPVHVEYSTISVNTTVASSLVEIASSSVNHYFVRLYASSRISGILGDLMYSNRMNTLLGMPVKLHLEQVKAFDVPPLSETLSDALDVPKGVKGHLMIPTMLHLRSVLLPLFRGGEDVSITAELPTHFAWTTERLNLMTACK